MVEAALQMDETVMDMKPPIEDENGFDLLNLPFDLTNRGQGIHR